MRSDSPGFKGTIPDGEYGAGDVKIRDSGTYDLLVRDADRIGVILHGKDFSGKYNFIRFRISGGNDRIIVKNRS
jgi:bifunctional non-homologous end joining protein LigD